MDITLFRIVTTVLGLICFLAICGWAYSKHVKRDFDEAAQLPFSDEDDSILKERPHSKEGK